MAVKVRYETKAIVTGGRNGHARTEDGNLRLPLSQPKELGGTGGDGANPEQLFAMGYGACFLSAVGANAAREGFRLTDDPRVTATVGTGPRTEGPGFGLTVALELTLPGLTAEQADIVIAKAHANCPYSNALRGNVDVQLSVLAPVAT
jgi:Ohr subfamily peroxiredoxin